MLAATLPTWGEPAWEYVKAVPIKIGPIQASIARPSSRAGKQTSAMTISYLQTKFYMPPWRADSVSRERLVERLDEGLDRRRKLTLLSAPAGYGKTTLLAEWIHTVQ